MFLKYQLLGRDTLLFHENSGDEISLDLCAKMSARFSPVTYLSPIIRMVNLILGYCMKLLMFTFNGPKLCLARRVKKTPAEIFYE